MQAPMTTTPSAIGHRQASAAMVAVPAVAAPSRRRALDARARSTTTTTTTTTTTATTATAPPRRATQRVVDDMKAAFGSLLEEHKYDLPAELIEGSIPPLLKGTYLRNGPGLQVAGRHTFDGDGCAISLCFPGAGAPPRFRSRYVRTPGFLEEQKAGRPTLRTAFTRGSPQGGLANPFELLDFDRLKNVSNTGLLQWQGRLLSLYESHRPTELSPADLATVGETDLGGQLKSPRLAAHYRVTGENGRGGPSDPSPRSCSSSAVDAAGGARAAEAEARRWVAFSANAGAGGSKMLLYEFLGDQLPPASNGGGASGNSNKEIELVRPPVEYSLAGSPVALVHDIAVTRDYYVIYESPLSFNVGKFAWEYLLKQSASVAECLEFAREQPARIHFIPRPGGRAAGTAARVAEAPSRFCFHHANAFQLDVVVDETTGEERVRVALDGSLWDEVSFTLTQHTLTPSYYEAGARSQLRRLVFDLGASTAAAAAGGGSSASSSSPSSSSSADALPAQLVSDINLLRRTAEFPSVDWQRNGRAARCVYASVDAVDDSRHWGPAQAVVKLTVPPTLGFSSSASSSSSSAGPADATAEGVQADVWEPGPRYIVGEPLFVPRPGRSEGPEGEDDGWVIVACQNAETQKGEVAILDARCLSKGPVARLRLPHFLPSGLHGSFTAGGLDSLSAPVGPPTRIREYK